MQFQMLIKQKCWKIKTLSAFKLAVVVFFNLIRVKMPTNHCWHFDIYEHDINFVLIKVEHGKSFINSVPGH